MRASRNKATGLVFYGRKRLELNIGVIYRNIGDGTVKLRR